MLLIMEGDTEMKIADVLEAVTEARAASKEDACTLAPYPRSRGTFLATADKDGQCRPAPSDIHIGKIAR